MLVITRRQKCVHVVILLLALFCLPAAAAPAVAFYYGVSPPVDELGAFDAVVLEPAHLPAGPPPAARTEWFAYVSVGEVHPSRDYLAAIPAAWRRGTNPAFDSVLIDQSQPAWAEFFAERVVQPLWQRGWRGVFLDTLDSYHLFAKEPAERARQEAGLAALVRHLRARFPGIRLFFNRGFEILPAVHGEVYAVAAESLYRGYDHGAKAYREVRDEDRAWLRTQLATVRDQYRLPAVAIDYLPSAQRELARGVAKRILDEGFVPWIATPELDTLGVGAVEVMPRRILMLYEKGPGLDALVSHDVHLVAAAPLNWLGYVPEYRALGEPLPEGNLAGRYAGVVCWFTDNTSAAETAWPWLRRQVDNGVPLAFFGSFGFRLEGSRAEVLGFTVGAAPKTAAPLRVLATDPRVGFESPPRPDRRTFQPLALRQGEALLSLATADGKRMDAIGIAPWGGYALAPYHVLTLPGALSKRWVVDPFAFLRAALRLPDMPVPDTTTETGRRMLIVHVDGDGFVSAAERPGAPPAGQVLLDEVLKRYPVPHTVSVIEGEIGKRGLYPKRSRELEAIARAVFALPQVEVASHSVSHPFRWQRPAPAPGQRDYVYQLDLPGYEYNAREEVSGSARYIDGTLAPAGKRTRVFLWTGDCNPDETPLDEAARVGLLNMNGGDTLITRSDPTITAVAPLGVPRGRHFQVYAPNQNENVYTRLWQGRYYGYERAIETFELTEAPRRLKPVNIYYHAYSASKTASLTALHKVYAWALAQPLHPVPASHYIERVLDFNRVVIARTQDGWRFRNLGALRTVRAPRSLGVPSGDLAGYKVQGDATHVHLARADAELGFGREAQPGPILIEANARVARYERRGMQASVSLEGHVPIVFAVPPSCTARLGGRALSRGRDGLYRLDTEQARDLELRCA